MIVIPLLLAVVAATQPTTAPRYQAERDRVVAASDALASAKSACERHLRGTDEYAAAKAETDAASAAIKEARAHGTPDDQKKADDRQTKAAAALKKLKYDAYAADPKVRAAQAESDAADTAMQEAINRDVKAIRAAQARDPWDGKVSKGMTYDELKRHIGQPMRETVSDQKTPGEKTVAEWERNSPITFVTDADGTSHAVGGDVIETLVVTMESGKVTAFERRK